MTACCCQAPEPELAHHHAEPGARCNGSDGGGDRCGSRRTAQYSTQLLLNRDTGAVVKTSTFQDGSLAQKLRAFVRFGHTGEYFGWLGQAIAALVSLGACVLVYTGLSLAIRRFAARLRRKRRNEVTRIPDDNFAMTR